VPISVSSHIIVSFEQRDNYIGEITRLKKFLIRKKTGQCTPEDMKNTYQNGQKSIERTVYVLLPVDRIRFHLLNVAREEETI
jgi:hypothetical protein